MNFDHFKKACEKYRYVYTLISTAYNGVRLKLRQYDAFDHVEFVDHNDDYSKLFSQAVDFMKLEAEVDRFDKKAGAAHV